MTTDIGYPETGRRLRCALFVDFDNVYLGLRRLDPAAAEAFAGSPGHWLRALERGSDVDGDFSRRFLIRACYLNPSAFSQFRPNFTRAGFSVVDCPSLTQQGKSSADINLVLDAVDALAASTHYDEFVILSADADFTPLALRCRAADRRVTIITAGPAASAYRAVADTVVTADELAELVRHPDSAADADDLVTMGQAVRSGNGSSGRGRGRRGTGTGSGDGAGQRPADGAAGAAVVDLDSPEAATDAAASEPAAPRRRRGAAASTAEPASQAGTGAEPASAAEGTGTDVAADAGTAGASTSSGGRRRGARGGRSGSTGSASTGAASPGADVTAGDAGAPAGGDVPDDAPAAPPAAARRTRGGRASAPRSAPGRSGAATGDSGEDTARDGSTDDLGTDDEQAAPTHPASAARRAVLRQVRSADRPLRGGLVARVAQNAEPGIAASGWAGAGAFFPWIAREVPEVAASPEPAPGFVWDPERFSEADLPGATVALPPLQRQVVDVTDIPNLPTDRYRVLLTALADDVAAHPFDRPETARRVHDACQSAGQPIGRSSVNTVIAGVLLAGLDLSAAPSADQIADTWADNVVGLCRGARMVLSAADVTAIRAWVGGGLAPSR